jgi:putative transposase
MYGVEVSPDLISTVTDGIVSEVTAWQTRPLESLYPVVFFDALRVKIRDEARVVSKAVYLALAILPDGTRDILGLWIEQSEGAKFWMKVFADLKTRGRQDILIAVTDGLKGMSEALAAIYPQTTLQTCIVHLLRNSLAFASWKERKALAGALRPIYTAPTTEAASAALEAFERSAWGVKFPTVVAAWRRVWTLVIPFFAFPPEIRRVIYTTNALESVHARLRKIIKTLGHFPTDEAGHQAPLVGVTQRHAPLDDAGPAVARGHAAVRRVVFRAICRRTHVRCAHTHDRQPPPHTKSLTRPKASSTVVLESAPTYFQLEERHDRSGH